MHVWWENCMSQCIAVSSDYNSSRSTNDYWCSWVCIDSIVFRHFVSIPLSKYYHFHDRILLFQPQMHGQPLYDSWTHSKQWLVIHIYIYWWWYDKLHMFSQLPKWLTVNDPICYTKDNWVNGLYLRHTFDRICMETYFIFNALRCICKMMYIRHSNAFPVKYDFQVTMYPTFAYSTHCIVVSILGNHISHGSPHAELHFEYARQDPRHFLSANM